MIRNREGWISRHKENSLGGEERHLFFYCNSSKGDKLCSDDGFVKFDAVRGREFPSRNCYLLNEVETDAICWVSGEVGQQQLQKGEGGLQ